MGAASGRVAIVYISLEGRYTQPSPEFLDLFGTSRDVVEGAQVGTFSPGFEEIALEAFREFAASGDPVSVSESVLTRPDGTTVEARAVVTIDLSDPRRYRATFEELPAGTVVSARVRTVANILAEWRAAERDLAALDPHDARRHDAEYRVKALRTEYQRMFLAVTSDERHPLAPVVAV